MSFFQDIPPPLDDDKTRDVDDYEVDDDNVSRISMEIPEISTNTNSLYNSSTIKPPEISAALFFDEPPPDDDYDPSKVSREDSFEDFVYHENSPDLSESSVQRININNTVIEEFVGVNTIENVIDDVESKLSQLQEDSVENLNEKYIKSEIDESSRALEIDQVSDDDSRVQGPVELILSPEEPNFTVSFDEPPLDEIISEEKNDIGAISSFSTSLPCDDDKIVIDTHVEEIIDEKINQNITECPQDAFQLDYDDDDDFNDFETAIPVHRTIETQSSVTSFEAPQDEFKFEADFSAFNEQTENDDDFGDFNDFETAPMASNTVQQEETHSIEFIKPSNVGGLIGEMFPKDEEINESLESNENYANMKNDEIVKKLDDFDATLALCYHYNNSSASQILVKALGIDTRNILLGAQWGNSSSSFSNMPRFASNLSFNPLEPLKPTSSANSSNKSENVDVKILAPQQAKDVAAVPEVQFDWNSSGLVNPLDGKQPNVQQSDDSSKVPPTAAVFQSTSPITVANKHPFENDNSNALDEEEMTQPESESSIAIGNQLNLAKFSSFQAATTSNSILVRERTIKLPETHIFTPVKSTSPVAREVVSRDGSPSTIVVKEYHDVEYLEPKRKDLESDFDDFQSATVEPVLMPTLSILEPQRVESKSSTISWPNPGQIIDDFSFMEISNDKKETKIEPPIINDFKPSTKNRELPVIGNSPSKQPQSTIEDDDFADFQAAPIIPIIPNQKVDSYQAGKHEQLTLSPSKLVSSMKNQVMTSQKPSWITSMDDDEVSRIEAAFPKCKVSPKPQQKSNNDEDDWSDFVGVPSTQQQINNPPVLNQQKSDDWSDFISAPPVAPIATVNSISSQILSKPNFTSWNQPVSRPYVHHATSFLSSEPKDFNYGQRMNITNNFNYQQNGISTILPDLDFAMPRSFNLPRSSNESSGKK